MGATEPISIRTTWKSYEFWLLEKVLPPRPLNAFAVPAMSRTRHCPSLGTVLLSASAPHLASLSPLRSLSHQYPDFPLPSSCLCRQNKVTNDPDTAHRAARGSRAWRNEALSRDGEGLAGGPGKRRAGLWPGQDTGTNSWSGGQVASGAAGL